MRKLVYIASPFSGEEENAAFARAACRCAIRKGAMPFAPHLLYPQMLDDSVPEERRLGMEMGMQVLSLCDELWLCGNRISTGMAAELGMAQSLGMPVHSISKQEILSCELSGAEKEMSLF